MTTTPQWPDGSNGGGGAGTGDGDGVVIYDVDFTGVGIAAGDTVSLPNDNVLPPWPFVPTVWIEDKAPGGPITDAVTFETGDRAPAALEPNFTNGVTTTASLFYNQNTPNDWAGWLFGLDMQSSRMIDRFRLHDYAAQYMIEDLNIYVVDNLADVATATPVATATGRTFSAAGTVFNFAPTSGRFVVVEPITGTNATYVVVTNGAARAVAATNVGQNKLATPNVHYELRYAHETGTPELQLKSLLDYASKFTLTGAHYAA